MAARFPQSATSVAYRIKPAWASKMHVLYGAPDADKLLRACLDAMPLAEDRKGNRLGVYADDRQVVDVRAIKLYATLLNPPGAYIEVDFPEPML